MRYLAVFLPNYAETADVTICNGTPRAHGQRFRVTERRAFAPIAITSCLEHRLKGPSPVGPSNEASPPGQPPDTPSRFPKEKRRMNPTIRIVTRGSNGELRTKDYEKHDTVLKMHTQIGIDDCSTDLALRGMPVFRGLIGPMPEGKGVVRYETPEVFETLTKEWSTVNTSRSRRRRTTNS